MKLQWSISHCDFFDILDYIYKVGLRIKSEKQRRFWKLNFVGYEFFLKIIILIVI